MALAAVLLLIAATLDRLLKTFALFQQGTNIPLVEGIFYWQPVVNPLGPLGLNLPNYIFPIIFGLLILGLGWALLTEREMLLRTFFVLALLGAVSNFIDRFYLSYVIDIFSVLGLSFNLADLYILVALGGYLRFSKIVSPNILPLTFFKKSD